MNETHPSNDMLKKTNLAASAPDPSEKFLIGLRLRLENQMGHRQSTVARHRRMAWGAALAGFLILTSCVLIAGPQNVVTALREALGYLPGFGVVRTTSLRTLAEPVTATQDGVTITIQSVVADSAQTEVVYEIAGLILPIEDLETPPDPNACIASPFLQFSDDPDLRSTGGGGMSTDTFFSGSLHFPALPEDVEDVTMVFPCLAGAMPGTAPENWGVPFHLVHNPAGATVFPLQPIDTPPMEGVGTPADPAVDPSFRRQISLRIESMAEVADGFILMGRVVTTSDQYQIDPFFPPGAIRITDSTGMEIPAEAASVGNDDYALPEDQVMPAKWAYKIQGKYFRGPLTISLQWITLSPKVPITISVDVGPQPHDGQTWILDRRLDLLGVPADVPSMTYRVREDTWPESMQGLEFTVNLPPEIEGLQLNYWEPNPQPGPGGTWSDLSDGLRHGGDSIQVGFLSSLPMTGIIGITANIIHVRGPWSATWDPPAVANAPSPTPVPRACLTNEKWDPIRSTANPALRPGLTGRLLLARSAKSFSEDLYLYNLDGSGERLLQGGTGGGMLSPDGTQLAFDDAEGKMFVQNLLTGETTLAAGDARILSIHWSPDGQWIGFSHQDGISPQQVFLVHPDGTGRRTLAVDGDFPDLDDWFPDSRSVLLSVADASMTGGIRMQRMDIATGTVTDVLPGIEVVGRPVLSPDGTRIVYLTLEFGRLQPWLYVARVDGSERRLISALDDKLYTSYPQWSPDGEWLLLAVGELGAGEAIETNVVLRPDTCEIRPLPQLQGMIESWVR